MNALLNMTVRDALRSGACCLFVGAVMWSPVAFALLRAKP